MKIYMYGKLYLYARAHLSSPTKRKIITKITTVSAEKPGKSPEKPGVSGFKKARSFGLGWFLALLRPTRFQGFLESLESQEKTFNDFRAFAYVKNSAEHVTRMISGTPGSSLIPVFPGKLGKALKSQEKMFHTLRAFPYVRKSLELVDTIA